MENIDEGGHGTKTTTNFGRGEGNGVLGAKFLIQPHVDEICSQFGIFDEEESLPCSSLPRGEREVAEMLKLSSGSCGNRE